jgi:hypothetical protein
MGKTSTPPEPQQHWLTIQYDPKEDHFLVQGSYSFTRPEINIDGFEAYKKMKLFLECFFHEVEAHKRAERKAKLLPM